MAKRRMPANPQAQYERILRALGRGQHRQALRQLEKLLPLTQADLVLQEQVYLAMADACLSLRELERAIEHATTALELNPEDDRAYYFLGFAYSVRADWAQAIPALRRAVALNPQDPEYYRSLGWALSNQEETKQEGQAFLEKGLQMAPTYIPILTDLAMHYAQEQRFDQALIFARRAIQLAPSDPMAQRILADLTHFEREFKRLGGQQPRPELPTNPATEAEWRELIAATDDYNKLVQIWINLHPAENIDALNVSLRELSDLWNSTPRPELGGRSPNEMMGRPDKSG